MQLRRATPADAGNVSSLIRSLSNLFTVSPTGESAEQFYASISEQAIYSYITSENFSYLVAEAESQLIGVVAMRDQQHLYHLFVTPTFQGKGLGRLLWSTARDMALKAGNPGEFTVNSSLNAVAVYERFGFVQVGARVETHGVAFIPMQWSVAHKGDCPLLPNFMRHQESARPE